VKRPAAASDEAAKPGTPWWSALFGHRGEAAAATTGGSEAERLLAESKRRGTSETPEARRREHDEARDRWQVLRNEVNRVAGASDTTTPPPLAKLESHAGAPAVPEPRPVEAAPRGVRATLSPVRAPAPSPLPELTAPEADRQDEAAAAPNRVRIHPPPQGSGRVRAAPLVIRGASARPGAEPASDDSCRCRIEGTVEVDSQDPLASRVQVAVSLAWYPAAADTVELFMGSPRAFRLAPAPCGPQRLKVVVLRGERLVVTSRDAVAGFRCDDRGLRQVRVVLAPR
jgi:hypothetical protein